jgi:hypothetical protein
MSSPDVQAVLMRGVLREGGSEVPDFQVCRRRPNLLRVDVGGFAEGFDGTQAWEKPSSQPCGAPVGGPAAAALWRAAQWPGPLRSLLGCRQAGHQVEMVGTESLAGHDHLVVRLTLSDGFAREYSLEVATGRLARSRDVRPLHPGQAVEEIETWFEDYRDVARIALPFLESQRSRSNGATLAALEWRTVVLDPTLAEKYLRMP